MNEALPLGLILVLALLVERTIAEKLPEARRRVLCALVTLGFGGLVVALQWVCSSHWDFLPFVVAGGFWLLPGRTQAPEDESPAWLAGWSAPLVAGILTAITVAWIWGGLRAVPVWHDESAYVLQAKIFGTGHWTAPERPLPEFFEQTHVFVTPVLAAKYPPGHSLLLVPGVWLGLPGLVPVLLNGMAGALIFLLARRFAGGRVAILTWLIWLTAPGALGFRASYLSQSTSSALWLLGWWLLVRWRETGKTKYLIGLALSTGALFLARPLTMFAFSIPVGVVVAREVVRRRAWGAFAAAIACGAAVLAIVPLWSYETLGDFRTTPYRQYSRVYYPYQWTGFTFDDTPALRPHPPEMDAFDRMFRRIQHEHRLDALPQILEDRAAIVERDVWGGGRRYLYAFAVLGILVGLPELMFALAGTVVLLLSYLVFAHTPGWSVYYMEGHGALAFATACGLNGVLQGLSKSFTGKRQGGIAFRRRAFALVCFAGVVLPSIPQLWFARGNEEEKVSYQAAFRRLLETIADHKSIVFVRYAPTHDPHRELVSNEPDLRTATVWVVHDRGSRDEELVRLAPGRTNYVYDEEHRKLLPLRAAPSPSLDQTGPL